MIQYIRNEVDNLIGIKYNNIMYYYIKNIQNDIIGILDSNNNVVCRYIYDSWGNILSITDSNDNIITDTNHIAYINPFRYRSYYYDSETNLYYLNSRYYNPVWGRFLNADGIVGANEDVLGYNLYAYCSNNFVNCCDSNGNSIYTAIKNFFTAYQRQCWQNVADLLNLIGMKNSSKFLEHSIQKKSNVKLDSSSSVAKDLKKDETINKYIDKKIKNKNGLFSNKKGVYTLKNTDLQGAFYHVTISSSGSYSNGCGRYNILVEDKYDFEWKSNYYGYGYKKLLFGIGNNLAALSYYSGAIQDYRIYINLQYDVACACYDIDTE